MVKILFQSYLANFFPWRPGTLAKNTFLVTGGMTLRAGLQFLLFICLARFLGIQEYGKFIAVLAVITFMVPLVGFGMPTLLLREVAMDRSRFAHQFGKSLIVTSFCAVLFLLIGFLVGDWLLPKEISRKIVFNVALAELFFWPIILLSGKPFQAIESFTYPIVFSSGLILLRLIGFGLMLVAVAHVSAESWSYFYLLATALAMICDMGMLFRKFGLPSLNFKGTFSVMREGFYFALSDASSRVNSEIDKVFLARFTNLRITGAYSAAYRFTDIIMLPINALIGASGARFFREGAKGMANSSYYAKKLLPIPIIYAGLGGLLLFFGADFIPLLLGQGFISSIPMLKWLAILPLILMIRSFFSMVVIVGGRTRYNGIVFLAGAMSNVGLNFYLIPHFGWSGAVLSTIVAEVMMIFFLWLIIDFGSGASFKYERLLVDGD